MQARWLYAITAMRGSNLRVAGASKELLTALDDKEATVRAVAARNWDPLRNRNSFSVRKAADDRDLLVGRTRSRDWFGIGPFFRPGVARDFFDGRSAYALALDT